MERRARLRLRLRGPHGRGVAPDRGARGARRGARLAAVRARPRGVRLALAHGRPTSPRSRAATSSSSPPGSDAYLPPGSPTSSATSSTTTPRRRRSTARSASSREPAAGRRSSSSPRPCSSSSAAAPPPRRSRSSARRSTVRARRSRRRSARSAFPSRRGAAAARGDRVRAGAALAAPLRLEQRHAPRAVLVPPHAVRRPRPQRRRLPRGATARARRAPRRPHDRGDDEAAHRPAAADARAARLRGRSRSPPPEWSCSRCCATRTASAPHPSTPAAKRDLRAADAAGGILDELERLHAAGVAIREDDVLSALDRATVRGDAAGEPGRVAVLDLARVRTRSFEAVFVIGLEQGSLPRRAPTSPFFDDETRRELDTARGARLQRPDAASRDRYLFYTACTRPRKLLTLVREAATDDGSPREASPFWEAVCELFDADDVRRHTTRRPLARLTWPIESAPTERERLRALARLAADDPREADALAYRERVAAQARPRASGAFSRPTAIRHPRALALLGEPGDVQGHRPRADGRLLLRLVRRALPPARRDRPGDRPDDARLDRARRPAALLQAAAGGDSGRGACDAGERRGGGRAHAPLRRRRARFGPADRRRRPAAPRARAGAAARPRAARAGRGGGELDVRAARARGVVQGLRARAGRGGRRQDRPRRRRPASARGGSSSTTSRARRRRPRRSTTRRACRSRSTCSCCATSSGSSRWAASTCRSAAAAGRAGCCAPGTSRCRASPRATTSTGRRSRPRSSMRAPAVVLAERIRAGRRRARPARRRLPGLVRPLAHVPQGAPVSAEASGRWPA